MKTRLLYLTCYTLLLLPLFGNAQLAITNNSNAQQLAQVLAGNGVTVSNVTITCPNSGSGTFTSTTTNLGINSGILLTTGDVTDVPQGGSSFANIDYPTSDDADLKALTYGGTGSIKNKCILEFDVLSKGNNLAFKYVFGSEEYPEYVCSKYNDVFGFFISGNKPYGGTYTNQNIALIPSSSLPVAINTVNPGIKGAFGTNAGCQSLSYSTYYVDNASGAYIAYDGFTKVLIAQIPVIPCQTYHLKLAIADVADGLFDSGVFLEENSLNTGLASVKATAASANLGNKSALEGCISGAFKFSIPSPLLINTTIKYSVSGSALNGTDYTQISDSVIILAGDTSASVTINPILDGITEGTESVVVELVDPCTGLAYSKDTLRIDDGYSLTVSINDSTLCSGETAQLTASGGVNYTWSPAAGLSSTTISNPIANPLSSTTYTCSYTLGACTLSKSVNVYRSNLIVNAGSDISICNTASYQLGGSPTASNGLGVNTYAWSPATGLNATNISNPIATLSNTYIVTVTDGNNCQVKDTVKIQTLPIMNLSPVSQNVKCYSGNTGNINLSVTIGTSPYTYVWSNGATTQNVTGLVAGTYTVTVKDGNNCSTTTTQIITEPNLLIASSIVAAQVSVKGGNNGAINTTVSGGTAPYTYVWSNGATTQNVTGLVAGTYTVTVKDGNNCSTTTTQLITEPNLLTVSSTVIAQVSCKGGNNGAINFSVTGGVSPYTYVWSNGATTQNVTGLIAGTYTVTVKDGNNISATSTQVITEPSQIILTSKVVNVKCEGESNGSIDLTVTGGVSPYSYNWNTSATTEDVSNLPSNIYSVTVLDANSCSVTADQIVNEPVKLQATNIVAYIDCYGGSLGSISLKVFGGTTPYIYAWSGGKTNIPSIQNIPSGGYSITVLDANNCSAKLNVSVIQPQPLTFSYAQTNNSCFGNKSGAIDLSVTGGTPSYSYNWSNASPTQDINTLSAGNYQVTITDAHNCVTVSPVISITEPSALTATATIASKISCNGGNNGAINLVANGGVSPYSYAWSNGATSQNINTLIAGNYTATVSDNSGCSVSLNATTLSEPSVLLATPLTITDAKCFGQNTGTITLNTTGGTQPYNFKWSDGAVKQNRDSLIAGTYTLTVTDKNACLLTIANVVNEPTQLVVSSPQLTNVSCNGGSNGAIAVTVTGATQPYSYNWNNGATTEDLVNLGAGTYSLSITDNNGCKNNSLTAKITQPQVLVATTNVANNVSCNAGKNGAVNLSVTGGTTPYNFNWSNNASTQNVASLSATSYIVTVTDAKSCKTTASAIVSEPAAIKVTASQTDVKCNGNNTGAIQLNVSGGVAPYSYNWNNNATSQNIASLVAGNYLVMVTDKNACIASQKVSIAEPTPLVASISQKDVSCFGKVDGSLQLKIDGGTPSYKFKWNNGSNLQNLSALNAGMYQATVSDASGCTQKLAATISQPAALTVNIAKTDVTCNGFTNGAALANATGGSPSYTYNWNNNTIGTNNQNLTAGNYAITVSDAQGCTISATTTIGEPAPITINQTVTTPLCPGLSTSPITTNVTGGRIPYTYNWGDDSKTQSKTLEGIATYSLTVTDANSCTAAKIAIVSQPASIVIKADVKGVGCSEKNKGTIDVQTTGGTPAYSYLWSNGQTSAFISNLSVGDYALTVTDKNACKASTILHVDSIAPMIANAVTKNVLCLPLTNGAIDLTVAQGTTPYQYFWSNGKTTEDLSNLSAGSYRVTVKDANGCMLTQFYSLKNDSAFHIQASPTVTITLGESTELNVTHDAPGSVSFDWNTTSESSLSCTACQNPTATPPYYSHFTVNATDDRGCVAKDTVSIFVIADHKLWVPNAFTPNGDGSNDFFQVFGNLKAMKNFEIKVFDRWGEKVFESDSPEFVWDGSFKGALLSGVLIYTLETAFADGSDPVHMKGSLTSIR